MTIMILPLSKATPFVNELAQQGQLDYPLFGLSLTRNTSGSLTLGAIDGDVVDNFTLIEWNRVVPFAPFNFDSTSKTARYLQWTLRLSNIGVNGTLLTPQPTFASIAGSSLVLFDIGTNGMFGPFQDVSRIFSLIDDARLVDQDAGQWALPCDTEEVLSFNFGHRNFTLQPTDYLIGPTSADETLCLAWPRAVASSGDGIDWQLGTPFLRTVYSIFSFGIDDKEPPMIGLYALSNITTINENATDISSFFASASATIATTLPNFLLSTITPTPPPYIFNTSVHASVGEIMSTDLGNSTYSPALVGATNLSALSTITASPTLATYIITDASGMLITSTSFASTSSVALGKPPGFASSARTSTICSPIYAVLLGLVVVVHHLV